MKFLLVALLAATALSGGALSGASADTRPLQGFTGVGADGHFSVQITLGDHYAVEVTGPDAARISTNIEGSNLRIRAREFHMFGDPAYDATVHITTPRLEALSGARGVSLTATGVRADHFSVAASMGAQLRVAGACQALRAAASMGGEVHADNLDCAAGEVSASMGGVAHVHLRESVNAAASMGGEVSVAGHPTRRDVRSTMGGGINYE